MFIYDSNSHYWNLTNRTFPANISQ